MRYLIFFLCLIALSCEKPPRLFVQSTGVEMLSDTSVLLTKIFDNGDTLQTITYCPSHQIGAAIQYVQLGAHYAHLNWMAQKEYHEIQDTLNSRTYVYHETGRRR